MADRRGRILMNRGTLVMVEFPGQYVEVYEVAHDQLSQFVRLAEAYFGREVRVLGLPRSGAEQLETIRKQMAGV